LDEFSKLDFVGHMYIADIGQPPGPILWNRDCDQLGGGRGDPSLI
jgi:hypothetical protein